MNMIIQIFIPTLNNMDVIDITLDSIRQQTYLRKNIFVSIMDFGSEDGTYEKILSYDSYHLGVYRNTTTKNPRLMLAEIMRANIYTTGFASGFSNYFYYLVLYPGEKIRKDCLEKCAQIIMQHPELRISALISESDVVEPNGHLIKQPLLFNEEKVLSGFSDYKSYYFRGYQHQVLCLKSAIGTAYTRLVGGEQNESRWWNKCHGGYFGGTNYYLPEKLAVTNSLCYADELEEILLRFESAIWQERIYSSFCGEKLDDASAIGRRENLAYYALWRSFLQAKRGKGKEAEDCWMMASIIDAGIKETLPYREMDSLLHGDKNGSRERLEKYFQCHGMN